MSGGYKSYQILYDFYDFNTKWICDTKSKIDINIIILWIWHTLKANYKKIVSK